MAGTGRILITLGLLILAFVAYQLWGTGVLQARAQNELEGEFDDLQAALESAPTTVTTAETTSPTSDPVAGTSTTTAPIEELDPTVDVPDNQGERGAVIDLSGLPQFNLGDPLGRITIERAGVDQFFVVGVGRDELKKGPGHYPGTPFPGSEGVAAIAGHRTTYGQPFYDLDAVRVRDDPDNDREDGRGDTIVTETLAGTHVYEVIAKRVVNPNETWVAAPVDAPIDPSSSQTVHNWSQSYAAQQQLWHPRLEPDELPQLDPDGAYLVLTTCNPRYSAAQRLVVFAELVVDERDDVQGDEAVVVALPGAEEGSESEVEPVTFADLPEFEDAESFEEGLGGDRASLPPALGWGLVVAAVGLLWWWAFRHWRNPATWFAGVLPFVVVLFFCYVYVERLLPSGY